MTGGFDTDKYAFELEPEHVGPRESLVLRHYRKSSRSDRPRVESGDSRELQPDAPLVT